MIRTEVFPLVMTRLHDFFGNETHFFGRVHAHSDMLLLSVSWKRNHFSDFTYFAQSNCCMHYIPSIVDFFHAHAKSLTSLRSSINERGFQVLGGDNDKVPTEITVGTYSHFMSARDLGRRRDKETESKC